MHKIFKTKLFHRWMTKIDLDDKALCISVAEMHDGLIDANLGSNIYKKRVAIKGQGKRGGARTIVASFLEERWFFIYGFSKNAQSNISSKEKEALTKLGNDLLEFKDNEITVAIESGNLLEVSCE
jgi:hypothetical protein